MSPRNWRREIRASPSDQKMSFVRLRQTGSERFFELGGECRHLTLGPVTEAASLAGRVGEPVV